MSKQYREAGSIKTGKIHYIINYDGLTLCGKTLKRNTFDILYDEDKEDLGNELLEKNTCKVCKKKQIVKDLEGLLK